MSTTVYAVMFPALYKVSTVGCLYASLLCAIVYYHPTSCAKYCAKYSLLHKILSRVVGYDIML